MSQARAWPRLLVIAGLVAMMLGALDPLEGCLLLLAGVGLVAFGAWRGRSRHGAFLIWSFALVLAGVGAMLWLSALGGIGGSSGRSIWWALLILPYPVGSIMGLIGALRSLRERAGLSGRAT